MARTAKRPFLRRLVHPLYKRLETNVHPLRYLFIEITQRCNLDCLHCGSDCGKDLRKRELTVPQWISLFDYLGEHCQKLMLVLTGGEPLCHPELFTILEAVRRNRLPFGMVTNGVGVTRELIPRLQGLGMVALTVSVDGLEANHDWLRGRKGSFAKVVKALEYCAASTVPLFDVVTCVNPRNVAELPQIMQLLEELGVPSWRLFSIFPKGRAAANQQLLMNKQQFNAMLDFIARARRSSTKLDVQFSCEGYMPPAVDRQVRDDPYFCRAGINIASVLSDGAIAACPNIAPSLQQGNILLDDLITVWDTKFEPFRRREWLKKGPCEACEQFSRCLGNSLHLFDEHKGHTGMCTYELIAEREHITRR